MTGGGYGVLAVGQVWIDGDGDNVEIITIDNPPYPVQFKWKNGTVGRDTVDGFLSKCSQSTPWWLERLAALRADLDYARELLALYHPPHPYPEHHMCPGCTILGRK